MLWVKGGLKDFQDPQGPRGQKESMVHLETQDNVENKVWVDFQVLRGSKVRKEISLWWISKVIKET